MKVIKKRLFYITLLVNRLGFHPLCFAIALLYLMKPIDAQAEGEIRLVDPNKECTSKTGGCGRVEIYHDNQWGTICNNYWDLDDATVACRQLGHPAALKAFTYNDTSGKDSGPIWLDNVRCEGIESRLVDCVFYEWDVHSCFQRLDAAVECQVGAIKGDVRLVNEATGKPQEYEGIVQLYNGKKWEDICIPDWGITESLVVCRQLDSAAATGYINPVSSSSNMLYICMGDEKTLDECSLEDRLTFCQDELAVRVTCSPTNPDSLADALYSPSKYAYYTLVGMRGEDMTLEVIRERTGKCLTIPAEITCVDKDGNPAPSGAICERRKGFLCDPKRHAMDCQKEFVVSVKCLRENPTDVPSLCRNQDNDFEYAPGETIPDPPACYARTCSSRGIWLRDYNSFFCDFIGPSPLQHPCFRECEYPPSNRTCDFGVWNLEFFVAGSSEFCTNECLFPYNKINETYSDNAFREAMCPQCLLVDGFPRMAAVVNRVIPGPAVQVCEGDRVIVRVVNLFIKDPTATVTIHWHGMFQEGTQYMDGAFMVSQCPIPFNEAFVYNFTAYPHGTHWWHSHAGLQYVDGVNGPLIVRQPDVTNKNRHLYDFDLAEHIIFLQDWFHVTLRNLLVPHFYNSFNSAYTPDAILINGRGGQVSFTTNEERFGNKNHWCEDTLKPEDCKVPRYAQFNVTAGKRYRFRTIAAVAVRQCSIRVSIDDHNLTIIATDGALTKPFKCKSFIIFPAERYDFVLDANRQPGNYWMRIEGLTDRCKKLRSLAIVHYEGAAVGLPRSKNESPFVPNVDVDPCAVDNTTSVNMADFYNLTSNANAPSWEGQRPSATFYLGIQHPGYFKNFFNTRNLPKLTNVTFCLPSTPFLLQENDPQGFLERCSPQNYPNRVQLTDSCGEGYCDCAHVLNIELGSVVELVFVNINSGVCHPFHLHGTNYRVVAQGKFGSENITMAKVREMNENGLIPKRRLSLAIEKDTMVAPTYGYTVVQFKADNPGWWFFHCHYDVHLALGMALVVHVDKLQGKTAIPPVPKTFPRCGDWPFGRDSDGEAYLWSEENTGNFSDIGSSVYTIAYKVFVQAEEYLRQVFNQPSRFRPPFTTYNVIRYRIRTDPVAGFHYFLLKIDTGEGCYIHLQLKMTTDPASRDPTLQACEGCELAESPLIPIKISSPDNLCRPSIPRVQSSSSASGLSEMFSLQIPVLVITGYLFIMLT